MSIQDGKKTENMVGEGGAHEDIERGVSEEMEKFLRKMIWLGREQCKQ